VVSPSPSDRSPSQVLTYNPLVAFYDIHGRKGEVLFFCFAPDTTRDFYVYNMYNIVEEHFSISIEAGAGRIE
jgi:hypothetical protein